jgi:phosphoglycolate phosphatase
MKYKNYIFDLDGTLLDTAHDIIAGFEVAFKTVLEIEVKLDTSIIGPPLIETVKKIKPDVSEEELAKIMLEFKSHYDVSNYPNTQLYSNVIDVLKKLAQARKSLFIATNKRLIPTMRLLKQFGIIGYFTQIYTSDKDGYPLSTKTQMVDKIIANSLMKNETCIIGDTSSDIKAGIENQIATYFVKYGYEQQEEVKHAPDYIISDMIEIIR